MDYKQGEMTPMNNDLQVRNHIVELLAKRRDYQQEIIDLTRKYQYVVFYGCGLILPSIIDAWNQYIGRKIDYCCDRDEAKWGKYFRGVKCISPQELMAIKDRCAVFVTIGKFKPAFDFLKESSVASVNQIYKYDLITAEFLKKNQPSNLADRLTATWDILSDARSVKVFESIVNRIFDRESDICIMADVCDKHQYFPPDVIKLSGHESLVDGGAFDGDTVADFIERTKGHFDNIFAFEMDEVNFNALQENVQKMPEQNRIKIFNLGIWDRESDITYSVESADSTIGLGAARGHVVRLDDILKNEKVTFIKMDIEGAEPQALRGAANIIRTQKPKLAICIYHDFKHLWEIPLYIKELVPEYKIYLRHHTDLAYETVCYAMV